MTEGAAAPPAARPPWGYVATFGWVVLAHVIASIVAVAVLLLVNLDVLSRDLDVTALAKDARLVAGSTIIANAVQVGLLLWIARMAGWTASDYFAFTVPDRREIRIGLIALVLLLPLLDAAAWLSGQPVVPQFQTDLYHSARSTGALMLLWFAIVVAAPLGEEAVFRGFIYRGWVRSARHAALAVVIIAAFFAIIHVQYNWFGILQVFCIGLLLTWTRWRSGSSLLPMAMHVITNAYSMLQTVVVIHWLS